MRTARKFKENERNTVRSFQKTDPFCDQKTDPTFEHPRPLRGVPLCRLCPATFVRPWRLAYGVCISGMNTHSGLAAGHRCLHEKATSSAKSLIVPTPPPGPVSGLQLCLARLIFRYLGSRAVSPNDTTMADFCGPRMALPVSSSRTSWSEKWVHFSDQELRKLNTGSAMFGPCKAAVVVTTSLNPHDGYQGKEKL